MQANCRIEKAVSYTHLDVYKRQEQLHIHPDSWLTAVYYVRVPKSLGDGPLPPGAIHFGPWPPDVDHRVPNFPRWHIEPQAGMLLIFPSCFGHGTVPTRSMEPRISISLNVTPCLLYTSRCV